jgi:hypothetical protein
LEHSLSLREFELRGVSFLDRPLSFRRERAQRLEGETAGIFAAGGKRETANSVNRK